jgi:hypothetical protein
VTRADFARALSETLSTLDGLPQPLWRAVVAAVAEYRSTAPVAKEARAADERRRLALIGASTAVDRLLQSLDRLQATYALGRADDEYHVANARGLRAAAMAARRGWSEYLAMGHTPKPPGEGTAPDLARRALGHAVAFALLDAGVPLFKPRRRQNTLRGPSDDLREALCVVFRYAAPHATPPSYRTARTWAHEAACIARDVAARRLVTQPRPGRRVRSRAR